MPLNGTGRAQLEHKGTLSSSAATQCCGTAPLLPAAGSGLLPEQLHPIFGGLGVQKLPWSWGRKGLGAAGGRGEGSGGMRGWVGAAPTLSMAPVGPGWGRWALLELGWAPGWNLGQAWAPFPPSLKRWGRACPCPCQTAQAGCEAELGQGMGRLQGG